MIELDLPPGLHERLGYLARKLSEDDGEHIPLSDILAEFDAPLNR